MSINRETIGSFLKQAIKENDTENIYRLINNLLQTGGAIPGAVVIFAAEQGNLNLMRKLRNNGVNMQTTTENGGTILHVAASYGHKKLVSWLLEENMVAVDVSNQNGQTPLNLAAESGLLDVVEILLKKDADMNHCDKRNHTPLYSAIIGAHKNVKDRLVEEGANTSCLLHLAAYHNQVKIIIKAVKGIKGFIDFTEDIFKQTPLHIAADCGHQAAIKALLKYGAKINECDNKGFTPLDRATQQQHTEIAQYLIENGARSGKGIINSISLYFHRHQKALYARAHALTLFNALVLLELNLLYLTFKHSDDPKLPSVTLGVLLLATIWLWCKSPVWQESSQVSPSRFSFPL